jgi:hypothetical protein
MGLACPSSLLPVILFSSETQQIKETVGKKNASCGSRQKAHKYWIDSWNADYMGVPPFWLKLNRTLSAMRVCAHTEKYSPVRSEN